MRNIQRSAMVALLLAIVSVASYAANEVRFDKGACENGNKWWSVSWYTNGELIYVQGLGCDGKDYIKYVERRILPHDPTAGSTPTFTGPGWYALLRYDVLGRVVWQGGKDAGGNFWEVNISYNPSPGGGAADGDLE